MWRPVATVLSSASSLVAVAAALSSVQLVGAWADRVAGSQGALVGDSGAPVTAPGPPQRPFMPKVPESVVAAKSPPRQSCKGWSVAWFAGKFWSSKPCHRQCSKGAQQRELNNTGFPLSAPPEEQSFVTSRLLAKVPHPVLLNEPSIVPIMNYSHPIQDCTLAVVRLQASGRFKEQYGTCNEALALDDRFKAEGKRLGFVLLGEEENGCTSCKALFENAYVVLRQYQHDDCDSYGNVMTVPLAVPKEQRLLSLQPEKAASSRKFVWSFVSGQKSPYAMTMVNELLKLHRAAGKNSSSIFVSYPTKGNRSADALAVACDSVFVLAPRANRTFDVQQLAEALQCGALPVVTDGGSYFTKYMPKRLTELFITVDDPSSKDALPPWQRAADEMEALLRDPAALDARQRRLIAAYSDYTDQWQVEVAARLADAGQSLHRRQRQLGSTRAAKRLRRSLPQ